MRKTPIKQKIIKTILEIVNFIFAFSIAACVAYTLSQLNVPNAIVGGVSSGIICFCLMGFNKLFIE